MKKRWLILTLVGACLTGQIDAASPSGYLSGVANKRDETGTLVLPGLPRDFPQAGTSYSLRVDVRLVRPPPPDRSVSGLVEARSLATNETVRIGLFSLFPKAEKSGETYSFNFDLLSVQTALAALGPDIELSVTAVDTLNEQPIGDVLFEVTSAKLEMRRQ
ncbi:hypothetical protein [Mesorhizobium sp.]|uniref:hypothetical protein n=1 Tax=Mesorhizobium sp. TaxID=1871066 RepID=UPI000FE92EAC|nr:hypothetical protein [Mesorhizobium sp.]RWD94249.1 MAG: hypothetical protein EOS39_08660 [Mesorhizobium sp.]